MTLNQLYHFQMVARYENFRRAADDLYISQPSVSRSIASLEEELKISLFEKNGRGVVLTKAGRIFLEYANRILEECEVAKNKMSEMTHDGGNIDIGYIFPLAGHYIPHHVRNFLNKVENKNVTFNFYQNHTSAISAKVKSGELDVGFGGYMERDDFEYFPVLSEEIILITPKEHALKNQPAVSIQELMNYPVIGYDRESWMGNYTKQLYKRFKLCPNIIVECPDEHSITALVREEFGIALIPRIKEISPKNLNVHTIKNLNLVNRTFMYWVKGRYQLPAVERFIQYMKEASGNGI